MKTNIFVVVLVCIIFCAQSYGQDGDIMCPVTNSHRPVQGKLQGRTANKGTASLSNTHATTSFTTGSPDSVIGPQDLVILFVDFPEGRILDSNGHYNLPTVDADTMYFRNKGNDTVFDAVGGMGYEKNPNNPSLLKKKIRKYTYDDYWDMYFSIGTYYGSAHPDSASHGVLAYGSFRDYYREVSYNKMDINPFQTKLGTPDKYHTGIINAIDSANGKKYVRWLMMPNPKSSYTDDNGDIKTPYMPGDVNPVLIAAHDSGKIDFDIRTYHGKIIIVGAGSNKGGVALIDDLNSQTGHYCSVREKRWSNFDNRSTLDGIHISVHEYGHLIGFDHLASSQYDPMNPTLNNNWIKQLSCPQHFNPIYKLKAGWIIPDDVIKKRNNASISLQPITYNPSVATYTVYGDAIRNGDYSHSEYYIVEYRKREGFNRFAGGEECVG